MRIGPLLALVVTACASVPELTDESRAIIAIDGRAPAGDPWIQFGAEELSGSTGCNSFRASYDYVDGRLSVGPIAATKRFCLTELATQESRLFELLSAPLSVRSDDGLVLESAQGSITIADR